MRCAFDFISRQMTLKPRITGPFIQLTSVTRGALHTALHGLIFLYTRRKLLLLLLLSLALKIDIRTFRTVQRSRYEEKCFTKKTIRMGGIQ